MDLYHKDTGAFDDWDADHDGVYGEIDFTGQGLVGTNLDKIDMVPDVGAGRVPASSEAELATYFQKVMDYEFAARESKWARNPSDWVDEALVVVDGGPSPFGDDTLAKQYAGPLADASISLVYRFKEDLPWSAAGDAACDAELQRLLNAGAGFLFYFGHGNRSCFSGWFCLTDCAQLQNEVKIPVVMAISSLTADFLDIDNYLAVCGTEWTGGAGPRPEPAAIQASKFDRDCMAEEFLVKRPSGAVAYIGATSVFEHGGKPLMQYFCEAYRDLPKPPALGDMWRLALTKFAQTDAIKGMAWYAFLHLHKVMLFGDPSVRVGGLQPGSDLQPSEGTEVEQSVMEEALC